MKPESLFLALLWCLIQIEKTLTASKLFEKHCIITFRISISIIYVTNGWQLLTWTQVILRKTKVWPKKCRILFFLQELDIKRILNVINQFGHMYMLSEMTFCITKRLLLLYLTLIFQIALLSQYISTNSFLLMRSICVFKLMG